MNENYDRLKALLNGYVNKTSSQEEENELFDLLNDANDFDVENLLNEILEQTEPRPNMARRERLLSKILVKETTPVRQLADTPASGGYWKRWAVAASIILAVGVGSYLLFFNKNKQNETVKTKISVPHDVAAPNVARATLKLDDGRIVYLDSVGNGQLAIQGNVSIVKTADGQIKYSQVSGVGGQEVKYNTITNYRGSKVETLTLEDGTQVWLNAESSITYPTAFVGSERKVTITGEADFVVKHNEKMPFKVMAKGVEIRDVGTEFNVNAYEDEGDIKVTLLDGSVNVINGNNSKSLTPGQQAILQAQDDNKINVVSNVNVEAVMAWKNGYFQLSGTNVQTIMRQIARWYDVEIVYEGEIPNRQFGGQIGRSANLSDLLKVLQESNLKCRIEGRKVIVTP